MNIIKLLIIFLLQISLESLVVHNYLRTVIAFLDGTNSKTLTSCTITLFDDNRRLRSGFNDNEQHSKTSVQSP